MAKKKKWMQEAVNPKEKGELRKKMKTPEGEDIPISELKAKKKKLQEKAKGDKKLSKEDRETLSQIQFALNARKSKKSSYLLDLKVLANTLDQEGFHKAADYIDKALKELVSS